MRLPSLVVAAGLALALTGCGGEEVPAAVPTSSSSPSAAATGSAAPSAEPEQSPDAPSAEGRLTGDGVDLPEAVVVFGTPYDEAAARLEQALGAPSKDTGEIEPVSDYGSCPGSTLRVLEYADGALQLLFGDVEADEPVLYGWALTNAGDPGRVPPASAFIGDVTTFELRVGQTTVGELEEQVGEGFSITEDELSLDPAFVLADQSSGFRGFLTGTSPTDTVAYVEAGTSCGE